MNQQTPGTTREEAIELVSSTACSALFAYSHRAHELLKPVFVLAILGMCLGSSAWGQAKPANKSSPSPTANAKSQTDAASKTEANPEKGEKPRVYVPARDLQAVIADKQGVLLSRKELDRLLGLAERFALEHPENITHIVESTTYQATLVERQVKLHAEVRLRQFHEGWQVWNFPMDRLSIESAEESIAGNPAAQTAPAHIGRSQNGGLVVLTKGAGVHELNFDFVTELATISGDQVAVFGLIPSAVGTLKIEVPAKKRLLVDQVAMTPVNPVGKQEGDASQYVVATGGRQQFQLRVTDPRKEASSDVLMFANTGYGVYVSAGEVTWRALTTLQTYGRPLSQIHFVVPAWLEITDVQGEGLESWSLADHPQQPKETLITVTFSQALATERKIDLKGVFAPKLGEAWQIPAVKVKGATSHIGQILVQQDATLRMKIEETSGVRRASTSDQAQADMPTDMLKKSLEETWRFDFWEEDFLLRLSTQGRDREVRSATALVLDARSTGLDLATSLTVESYGGPLFEVDLRMAADWQLKSAVDGGRPVPWAEVPFMPGERVWRLTMNPPIPAGGSRTLLLGLQREIDPGKLERSAVDGNAGGSGGGIDIDLPELYLPQASLAETAFVVRGDSALDLLLLESRGLDPVPLKASWERLRFQSQDTRYGGRIRLVRKLSRLAVETVAFARLDPQSWNLYLQGTLDIKGGGIDRLQIVLPESAGTALQWRTESGPAVQEQHAAPAKDGEILWTIKLAGRLTGQAVLSTQLTQPREAGLPVTFPLWRFPEAERQHGYLVVEAAAHQHLTIDATTDDDETLIEGDTLDMPASSYVPRERIVAVYQMMTAGVKLTVSDQQYPKVSLPTAVVRSLTMTSVIGSAGQVQHQAKFDLALTGVQNLAISLPAETQLWGALWNGEPVELRRSGNVFIAPLGSSQGSVQGEFSAFYAEKTSPLSFMGSFARSTPELGVMARDGKVYPVDILDQTWNVHHPSETRFLTSDGLFEPIAELPAAGWLTALTRDLQLPSGNETLPMVVCFALTAMTLGVFRFLMTRSKLAIGVLLVAFISVPFIILVLLKGVQMVDSEMASAPYEGMAGVDHNFRFGMNGHTAKGEALPKETGAMTPPPAAAVVAPSQDMVEEELADRMVPSRDGAPAAAQSDARPDANDMFTDDPRMEAIQTLEAKDGRKQDLRRGLTGRLSLAMSTQIPVDSISTTFRYHGIDRGREAPALQATYLDDHMNRSLRAVAMMAATALGWFLWRANRRTFLAAIVFSVAVCLAFAPVAFGLLQPLIDGLLLGTLGSLGLVLLRTFLVGIERMIDWIRVNTSVVSALLLLAVAASSGDAQPPTPAEKTMPPSRPTAPEVSVYTDNNDPLAADKVFLPRDEFLKLMAKAHVNFEGDAKSPLPSSVTSVMAVGRLATGAPDDRERAFQVQTRMAVHVVEEGIVRIPLPLAAVPVTAATCDGKPANLRVNEQRLELVVTGVGWHVLDLEYQLTAELSGETGRVKMNWGNVPSGQFSLIVPKDGLAVRVNGATSGFRMATREKERVAEIPLDRGNELLLTWQPEQRQQNSAADLMVESTTAVMLQDAGLNVSNGYELRIRQGALPELVFATPDSMSVTSIQGPDVANWEFVGAGADRQVRVTFRKPITETTRLTIDAFRKLDIGFEESEIPVIGFSPLGAATETGRVALFFASPFRVRVRTSESTVQMNVDQFPTNIPVTRPNRAPDRAYRFSQRPLSMTLAAMRERSDLRVLAEHGLSVEFRKVKLSSRFTYQLMGAPRSTLTVALPANWVPLNVEASGLKDWYVVKGAQSVLVVELQQPRHGTFQLALTGQIARDPQAKQLPIEVPVPLAASQVDSKIAAWMEPGENASIQSLGNWKSVPIQQLSSELGGLRKVPPALAFSSSESVPTGLTLNVARDLSNLLVETLSMPMITDVAVNQTIALQWVVSRSATDQLTFLTPREYAGRFDFQGDNLRDVTHRPEGENFTRWTVSLRSPVLGKCFISGTATFPPAKDSVSAIPITFDDPRISSARQHVLLINRSSSQLSLANPDVVEAATRTETPIVIDPSLLDQATEFLRTKEAGVVPNWTMQKFPVTRSAPASVNLADLVTVIARDGSYFTRADYTINNISRQYLALRLPERCQLLGVQVSGSPSRAMMGTVGGKDALLIPLPKTSVADLSFLVQVTCSGKLAQPLPRGLRKLQQEVDIPSPTVIGLTDDSDFGIPTSRTRWSVYLPDDLGVLPLQSTQRNNLSLVPEESRDLIAMESLLGENSRQMLTLMNGTSERQRARAYFNLKQLQSALKSGSGSYYGNDDSHIREETVKLERQLQELEKGITVDSGSNSVKFFANGENANGVTLEQSAAAQQFESNFDTLNRGNTLEFKRQSEVEAESRFGFVIITDGEVPEAKPPDSSGAPKPTSKPTSKAGNKANEVQNARARYQRQNDEQLKILNDNIQMNRGEQQQGGDQSVQKSRTGSTWNSLPQKSSGPVPQFGGPNNSPTATPMFEDNDFGGGLGGGGKPRSGEVSGSLDSSVRQEFAKLVEEYNELVKQRRYVEAEVIGKKAKELDPKNPVSETLVWKARFLRRNEAIDRQKNDKEGSFLTNLQKIDEASVISTSEIPEFATGMSLPMEIPLTGRMLTFTKAGGEAKLALWIWPNQNVRQGISWGWCLGTLLAGLVLVSLILRAKSLSEGLVVIPWLLIVLSLFFLLVPGLRLVGSILLAIGLFIKYIRLLAPQTQAG